MAKKKSKKGRKGSKHTYRARTYDETNKRDLNSGDITGINKLY